MSLAGAWRGATGLWTSQGPDDGAPEGVASLAIDPSAPETLYAAATAAGVFKSTDGAATWGPASAGLPRAPIVALAIDPTAPQTLYAASDDGVFKSTDGAATWNP